MTFLNFAATHPFAVAFGVVLAALFAAIVWAMIAADSEGR